MKRVKFPGFMMSRYGVSEKARGLFVYLELTGEFIELITLVLSKS